MSGPRTVSYLSIFSLVSTAALVAVVGCAHESNSPTTPAHPAVFVANAAPTAIGGGPADDSALSQAIRARCVREERCDNIGEKRPYATMDDCIANVAVMHADDFAGLRCDGGVRSEALSECLSEINHEQCVPAARFASCRSIGLCNSI